MTYQDILNFWFNEIDQELWFKKDDAFDQELLQRFGTVHTQAKNGELSQWRDCLEGCLAEIIVLDQFSRNLFRAKPDAFAYDGMALVLAQEAIRHFNVADLPVDQQAFLYMPFMHSESLVIHEEALTLFAGEGLENNYAFELKHKVIIERFGRYPHRNQVLGRESTPEELVFLAGPDSAF